MPCRARQAWGVGEYREEKKSMEIVRRKHGY